MTLATPSIALITTGGTIASKRGENGASTPVLSGGDLMGLVPGAEAKLRAVNLMTKDPRASPFQTCNVSAVPSKPNSRMARSMASSSCTEPTRWKKPRCWCSCSVASASR